LFGLSEIEQDTIIIETVILLDENGRGSEIDVRIIAEHHLAIFVLMH
jgi:hypothetical protein